MTGDRKIKEAIETMSGTRGQQSIKLVECEVISVDESKRTCNVSVIGGNAEYDIENVRLMATIDDGLLIIPTVGSQILVAHNNQNVKYICQFSEIEKVLLITGETSIEIKDGSVKFNDGSFDGFSFQCPTSDLIVSSICISSEIPTTKSPFEISKSPSEPHK